MMSEEYKPDEREADMPSPDEIHQMAFEEGQPADNGDGYLFTCEEFDCFVQRLLDSLAAWQRAQSAPVVPEGWRLVPKQPTDSMVQAVIDSGYYATPATAWPILVEEYKAMLTAAPQPAN